MKHLVNFLGFIFLCFVITGCSYAQTKETYINDVRPVAKTVIDVAKTINKIAVNIDSVAEPSNK